MSVKINDIIIGDGNPFALIAGPCVVESEQLTLKTAEEIKKVTSKLDIPFIFKSSFKKANRTSLDSFSSLGDDIAISILKEVKKQYGLPIITDVHSESDIDKVSDSVDLIQIPAFLSRQTDLLLAAGKSGKVVNIKKGQFLAPDDMKFAVQKVASTGNKKIMITERGTSFGYHNLIVDMRSLVIMRQFGYPIVMDATHSVQLPSLDNVSGGQPFFIKPLARAAVAVGIDALFLEVHPDPPNALSDAASQLKLSDLEELLKDLKELDLLTKKNKKV